LEKAARRQCPIGEKGGGEGDLIVGEDRCLNRAWPEGIPLPISPKGENLRLTEQSLFQRERRTATVGMSHHRGGGEEQETNDEGEDGEMGFPFKVRGKRVHWSQPMPNKKEKREKKRQPFSQVSERRLPQFRGCGRIWKEGEGGTGR